MLALIAGRGHLPDAVAAALPQPPLVCALQDQGPDRLPVALWFRLETLGSLIAELRARGVAAVCMAGSIGRPALDPVALDAATRPLVPRLMTALGQGDDGALRAVIGLFEDAGISVRAAHDIAPHLLPPAGCPTRAQPQPCHRADAARGAQVVAGMARADTGQACAILNGQAIALELSFGTDWMLASLAGRPDDGGGLLFKAPKPGQDRRADLPAIGPATIRAAHAGGLEGVVIEAGGVLVLEHDAVLRACDELGLFLWLRAATEA